MNKARPRKNDALQRVIDHFGSVTGTAEALDRSPGAISKWKRVPHSLCLRISHLTGIPTWELRPDLYPKP